MRSTFPDMFACLGVAGECIQWQMVVVGKCTHALHKFALFWITNSQQHTSKITNKGCMITCENDLVLAIAVNNELCRV